MSQGANNDGRIEDDILKYKGGLLTASFNIQLLLVIYNVDPAEQELAFVLVALDRL